MRGQVTLCLSSQDEQTFKQDEQTFKHSDRRTTILCIAQFRARRTSTPILPTICLSKTRNSPRVRTLISIQSHIHSLQRVPMPKQHTYVLGLNTYDHDVSACLLRDGAIAFAIAKERITREKHATGFYREVIDYCLDAEGITLDDVDLIVRNCYILPVPEMEERLVYQDMPGFLPEHERPEASKHPLYLSHSDKVVSISHHLAHAYSAFAVSPFEEGVVMIVDGVGSYQSDVMEPYPATDTATPLARESESYYKFSRHEARMPEEGLDGARSRLPERRILQHARPRRALQPGLVLHLRRLEQVRRADGAGALRQEGAGQASARTDRRHLARSALDHGVQAALRHGQRREMGDQPIDAALGGSRLAGSGRYRKRAARPRPLAARNDRRQKPVHRRRRRAELRGQWPGGARGRLRKRLDPAGGRR